MDDYKELLNIRGEENVQGLFDYLNSLKTRIRNKTTTDDCFFGETLDDSQKYSSYCLFSIPDWLSMGETFEEWLAYALSLNLTNIYINSEELELKRANRKSWLRSLKISNSDKVIEANEKDCLSLISSRKKDLVNLVNTLDEASNKAGYESVEEYFGDLLTNVADNIRKNKNEEILKINDKKARCDSILEQMYDDAVDYFKANTIHWEGLSEELRDAMANTENRYNVRFMQSLCELAKMQAAGELGINEQSEVDVADINNDRNSIPSEVRREVWRRDQGRCTKCGSRENLEYDHIIPVSKGGGNTARNIELLCQNCNRSKSNKIL
jgi:hypothetical protein